MYRAYKFLHVFDILGKSLLGALWGHKSTAIGITQRCEKTEQAVRRLEEVELQKDNKTVTDAMRMQ